MAERSVNKAILVGRLGGDAETRYTQGGTPVSRFSLAMNRQWRELRKTGARGDGLALRRALEKRESRRIFDQRGPNYT